MCFIPVLSGYKIILPAVKKEAYSALQIKSVSENFVSAFHSCRVRSKCLCVCM